MEINGDKTHITKKQDITGLLNSNKAQANERGKKTVDDCYNKVATIPASIIVKWKWEEGIDVYSNDPWHQKKVKEKLNSNEYRHLRTSELVI